MSGNDQRERKSVPLGYISGVFGVQGWVKVHSWTDPRDAILSYPTWQLGEPADRTVNMIEGRLHGKTVVAALEGVGDRDAALSLRGAQISVPRSALPELQGPQWYWTDLVGLEVRNREGDSYGRIGRMMETGAHDVMVVNGERERLIPFVVGPIVKDVNLEQGLVVVDWQADYLE